MLSCEAAPAVRREIWRGPAPLGVGLPFLPGLDRALYRSGLVDFVEVTPDLLCRPRRGQPGMALDPSLIEAARESIGDLPIVVHGVELSIGSAGRWNDAYVDMLAEFQSLWPFRWHSEHLHFQTIDQGDGRGEAEIGVPLPLPFTHEAIMMVAERTRRIDAMFGVPFHLENGAHYLGQLPRDDDVEGEADFLNRIALAGKCGLLLDLHNLHCNEINNGDDAMALIDRLRLDQVGEIHIAGGSIVDGFRLDAHDGRTPEAVWRLLDAVLPRCLNIGGVVFEIMPDHALALGYSAILEELARLRTTWARRRSKVGSELCLA